MGVVCRAPLMVTCNDDRNLLDRISIATPCSADWNTMQGDDKKRFCAQCKLHVHNLSGMSADEALDLLRASGQGRLCVRLFRRADGTVLTRDCPVGLRQKLRAGWARGVAMMAALWAGAVSCVKPRAVGETAPAPVVAPEPQPVKMGEMVIQEHVMGDFAPPREILGKVAQPSPIESRPVEPSPIESRPVQEPPK